MTEQSRSRRAIFALCSVLFSFSPCGGFAQARRALLIGINGYTSVPSLAKAVGDAQALKVALVNANYEVDLVVDPDRRQMNVALSAFTNKLRPGDVALFHFSGHGVTLDGENYLLPKDVLAPGAADKELLKSEGIPLSSVIDRLRAAGTRTQVLVIDACRDNPYATSGTRSLGSSRGLARVEAPKGTFIMYSAGYGQTALDRLGNADTEATSLFTRTLLRTAEDHPKPITDLAREVRERVEELALTVGHEQRPAYYDELSGPPFYLFPDAKEQDPGKPRNQVAVALAPTNTAPKARADLYRVLPDVSQGVHNMRSGPGTRHPLVVPIPAGTEGITLGTCRAADDNSRFPWCEASWGKFRGWVSSCCLVDASGNKPAIARRGSP